MTSVDVLKPSLWPSFLVQTSLAVLWSSFPLLMISLPVSTVLDITYGIFPSCWHHSRPDYDVTSSCDDTSGPIITSGQSDIKLVTSGLIPLCTMYPVLSKRSSYLPSCWYQILGSPPFFHRSRPNYWLIMVWAATIPSSLLVCHAYRSLWRCCVSPRGNWILLVLSRWKSRRQGSKPKL